MVAKTALVNAPLAIAFEVFAGQRWWLVSTHHVAEPPGTEVVLEPFHGGRWYERADWGTETDWGTVLAWQPPYRLLLTWQVSPGWTREEDPDRGSRIEVTFTPEGPDVTRVDLTHRHLERYGRDAERMRRILDGKGGEPLTAFARHIAALGGGADGVPVRDAQPVRRRRRAVRRVLPRPARRRRDVPGPRGGGGAARACDRPPEPYTGHGNRRAYVTDPDGNWLALVSKPPG